jgi:hypothetical protein
LIVDTEGNVFGRFTPVKEESSAFLEEYGRSKGDDRLRSFLFTLRNPRGLPPRKFALRAGRKQRTVYCNSTIEVELHFCLRKLQQKH